MFYVQVRIKSTTMSGLTALDRRRYWGLKDESTLCTSGNIATISVSEGFARDYEERFRNITTIRIEVPLESMLPGELEDMYSDVVTIRKEVITERFLRTFM